MEIGEKEEPLDKYDILLYSLIRKEVRDLKKFFLTILSLLIVFVWVSGYYRSNGTYVSGHYRSRPNAYTYDNYSYSGGSRYNSSYYSPSRSYSSSWYTPSFYDSDYWYGSYYNSLW